MREKLFTLSRSQREDMWRRFRSGNQERNSKGRRAGRLIMNVRFG
jgi:hypothetical protein